MRSVKVKSHFRSHPQTAWVRFPHGTSGICAAEIRALAAQLFTPAKFPLQLAATDRSIRIEGASLRTLAELCLRTRTAKDILWQMIEAPVRYESELEELLSAQPWQMILPAGANLHLRAVSKSSRLFHTGLLKEKMARALHDRGFGTDPEASAVTTLELRVQRDKLSLSLSLAGEPLSHRKYRAEYSHRAPLGECLAAACIDFARAFAVETDPIFAEPPQEVYAPFAGSGTLGFEAALAWAPLSPCLFRETYAVDHLLFEVEKTLGLVRKRAAETRLEMPLRITFLDDDGELTAALCANCSRFKKFAADERLAFAVHRGDFFDFEPALRGPAAMFINPPYGVRLEAERGYFSELGRRARAVAAEIGPLWGFILVPEGEAEQRLLKGLSPKRSSICRVTNGGIKTACVAFVI